MSDNCVTQIFHNQALLIAECRNDAYHQLQDYIRQDFERGWKEDNKRFWDNLLKGDGINRDLLFEPEY